MVEHTHVTLCRAFPINENSLTIAYTPSFYCSVVSEAVTTTHDKNWSDRPTNAEFGLGIHESSKSMEKIHAHVTYLAAGPFLDKIEDVKVKDLSFKGRQ